MPPPRDQVLADGGGPASTPVQRSPGQSGTALPTVQRGKAKKTKKTTKHNHNYLKRTRALTAKLNKELFGTPALPGFLAVRSQAERYARKLDENRTAAELKYKQYITKAGRVHPTWSILSHAAKMAAIWTS